MKFRQFIFIAGSVVVLLGAACNRSSEQQKLIFNESKADSPKLALDTTPLDAETRTPDTLHLAEVMQQAGLVDVQQLDSSLFVELRYATDKNFVHTNVYGSLNRCFLQKAAADKLIKAHQLLKENYPNLRLLIYDGARPRRVQQIFWDKLDKPDSLKDNYVADPAKGSIHNYGCAVDLTLSDASGKALDMGTEFDFFGLKAYPLHEAELLKNGQLTQQQVDNRLILRKVMTQAGFTPINSEWWHFDAMSRRAAKANYGIIE